MGSTVTNFEWVKARAECSLESIFLVLSEAVSFDVQQITALNRPGVKFQLNNSVPNRLLVLREREFPRLQEQVSVVFELMRDRIEVSRATMSGKQTLFSAVPGLNPEEECLLEVSGMPLNPWQFRRKALEDLFFGF
jgi:hypothetical protein